MRRVAGLRFAVRAERVNERKNFRNMASGSGLARRWLDRRCRTRREGRHHAIDRFSHAFPLRKMPHVVGCVLARTRLSVEKDAWLQSQRKLIDEYGPPTIERQ
jgi:hypothetical protein